MQPILSALFAMDSFPQTLNPFTGTAGFTQKYSPAILCMLDFVERLSGILPRPDGTLWFSGLVPKSVTHRQEVHETAYGRTVDGTRLELLNTATECHVLRDGELLYSFPAGVRLIADRTGALQGITSLSGRTVRGEITGEKGSLAFNLEPNQELVLDGGTLRALRSPGIVYPHYD